MATLTVLKFDTPSGAEQMLRVLEGLQKQQLITIQDATNHSTDQSAATPNEPPSERKKAIEEVAAPMSRGSAAF